MELVCYWWSRTIIVHMGASMKRIIFIIICILGISGVFAQDHEGIKLSQKLNGYVETMKAEDFENTYVFDTPSQNTKVYLASNKFVEENLEFSEGPFGLVISSRLGDEEFALILNMEQIYLVSENHSQLMSVEENIEGVLLHELSHIAYHNLVTGYQVVPSKDGEIFVKTPDSHKINSKKLKDNLGLEVEQTMYGDTVITNPEDFINVSLRGTLFRTRDQITTNFKYVMETYPQHYWDDEIFVRIMSVCFKEVKTEFPFEDPRYSPLKISPTHFCNQYDVAEYHLPITEQYKNVHMGLLTAEENNQITKVEYISGDFSLLGWHIEYDKAKPWQIYVTIAMFVLVIVMVFKIIGGFFKK
jgi:hypothetical protein